MSENNDALSNLLGGILSDPSAREGIGKVMDMLVSNKAPDTTEVLPPAPSPDSSFTPPFTGDTVTNIISAIENMNPSTDAGMNLLTALRPYLRPSRANRMNTVIRLMQISKVAPLFTSDLFLPKGEVKEQKE